LQKDKVTKVMPLIPARNNLVVFPGMFFPFMYVGRDKSLAALKYAMDTNKKLIIATQKDPLKEEPSFEDVYEFGTVCEIVDYEDIGDDTKRISVAGLNRAKIRKVIDWDNIYLVETTLYNEEEKEEEKTLKRIALFRNLKETFTNYIKLNKKIPTEPLASILAVENAAKFTDLMASILLVELEVKQKILETVDLDERMMLLLTILKDELQILNIEKDIEDQVKEHIDKAQEKFYLMQKYNEIKKKLNIQEDDEFSDDIGLDPAIKKIKEKMKSLPKQAKESVKEELSKIANTPKYSPEYNVSLNYMNWLVSLPWKKQTKDLVDIDLAEKILDENHYGLRDVKDKILEYLAGLQMSKTSRTPILCFVGPPGVGKTSVAKSLAQAMNRKFVRMSLGGISDESEIRGHRRTYVAAMPGRIIQLIKKSGVKNPVLLMDEIDKITSSIHGDPYSALLEALDPEQNKEFVDHYIEVPFDLSKVFFITTANVLYTIPSALRDRMEIIRLDGYTRREKLVIAKNYLLPEILSSYDLKNKFKITDAAILSIIDSYTREAGVRELKRKLENLIRIGIKKYLKNEIKKIYVNSKNIQDYLGIPEYYDYKVSKKSEIGVATGLAWTSVGGAILEIETQVLPGSGKVILTGRMGDVMKESAQIAYSHIKTYISKKIDYSKIDLHIHIPEGAVPKDGPSAGITLASAMYSSLAKKPIRKDIAMTGEISLRGKVLPIGGLKEKTLAAYRNGIKEVIIPKENEKDLPKIPDEVRNSMTFHLVENFKEVISILKK
jgi:ATP-dependent Lon protease